MSYYLSIIHWTNDAGNQSIVGVFDDMELATAETRKYFASVQGEIQTETMEDLVMQPDDMAHRIINFNGELDSNMVMMYPNGSADIYETALNATFAGSVMVG